MHNNWQPVIGLEVHVQLLTKSKIFSTSPTQYGALPNTQASIIDLGFPGTLPVLNEEVVKKAIKFGLSIGAVINKKSIFARKNYFYPDLPKGYQISQFETPIVGAGTLTIRVGDINKTINIVRAHLEEDAGKSIHEGLNGQSGIDLNRAGVGLLEIVSAPDLANAKEAVLYLKSLHTLVKYLGICDGNMQEGSFRCDANVSIHRPGTPLGTRAEIKNVNSFRFVEKAIDYEIARQIAVLESGGRIVQETRLYDADKDETRPMRAKEEANDYRYFPDPDLLPLIVSDELISTIKKTLPELPKEKSKRFINDYGLSIYDAEVLVQDINLANYYEAVVDTLGTKDYKLAANWVLSELLGALNKANLELSLSPVNPKQLGILVKRIADNTISGKIAKNIFDILWQQGGEVDSIIEQQGLRQVTDTSAITEVIEQVLAANSAQVEEYKSGKERVFGFLVGQIMKASKGKANPELVNKLLKERLS